MLIKVYESSEFTEYIDYDTLEQKNDSEIYCLEEVVDFANPKKLKTGESYKSIRIHAQFDLKLNLRKSILKLACSDSMGGGNLLLRDETDSDWEKIIPDSNNEKKLHFLLKSVKSKS